MSTTNYCTKCGSQIDAESKFCPRCGASTEQGSSPVEAGPSRSTGKRVLKWTGLGCGGLITLLIILIIIGVVLDSEDDNVNSTNATPQLSSLPFDRLVAMSTRVSYDDLFRNNERHIDALVYFRGQIVQIADHNRKDNYVLRVNVTETGFFWEDAVYLHYSGPRVLEDDIIEFIGRVKGLKTYKAILGNSVTVPEISIIQAQLIAKSE